MRQRNFLKPGDRVQMTNGEILTVKSLEFREFVPVERAEYVPKREIHAILERDASVYGDEVHDQSNDMKWGVHVLGPDNVLAAHSFREAVEKCHEINMAIIMFSERAQIADNDLMPRVFAQVAPWEQIASGPHDPDETDWANACA